MPGKEAGVSDAESIAATQNVKATQKPMPSLAFSGMLRRCGIFRVGCHTRRLDADIAVPESLGCMEGRQVVGCVGCF